MEKERLTGIGAMLAGGIGAVCCVGPVLLTVLGLSGGVINAARGFGFLDIPMTALAFLLLGTAFYLHYRKQPGKTLLKECCETGYTGKKSDTWFLWAAFSTVLFLFLFPYIF